MTTAPEAYTCNGVGYCEYERYGDCTHCRAKAPFALRAVADWLEANTIRMGELIGVSSDKWGEQRVHIHLSAARRLWPGRKLIFDHVGGHCTFCDGDVTVVVSADREIESCEVIL